MNREVLVKTDGTLAKEGDYVVNLKLAKTLQVIANEGPTAFYNGSLTADIVNEIQQHGMSTKLLVIIPISLALLFCSAVNNNAL